MSLYEYIIEKNPHGFAQEDATQLFLLLYCRVDPLPENLRNQRIDRKELALTFSRLAREGKITRSSELDRRATQQNLDLAKEDYWQALIDDLLHGRIDLDPTFLTRCTRFV